MNTLKTEKGHPVKIKTGHGDIMLSVPENIRATIQAKVSEDYKIRSDFSLVISTVEKSGDTTIQANGDINGGGVLIYLETGAGDIHLQKKW